MKYIKKIGWQKYEDYIEKQLTSPVLHNIINSLMSMQKGISEDDEDIEDDDTYEDEDDEKHDFKMPIPLLPLTNQLVEDLSTLSSFDCWIGHTNFDITPHIKNILDSIPGIEFLKIYSRYRFFIGIGKMFDFAEVRKTIEDSLIGDDQ
jgi:hypothetical protein